MTADLLIPAATLVLSAVIEAGTGGGAARVIVAPGGPSSAEASGESGPDGTAALVLHLLATGPDPHRTARPTPRMGEKAARPLAVDYLLTTSGPAIAGQHLLSAAIAVLDGQPHLTADAITQALHTRIVGLATTAAPDLGQRFAAPPAEWLGAIRIAAMPADLAETAAIWAALRAPLRPSARYRVTVNGPSAPDQ